MSKWLVKAVGMEIDRETGIGGAHLRIDDVMIFNVFIKPDDQGQLVVCKPTKEPREDAPNTVFDYLDDELEAQVDQALREAYAREWANEKTPTKGAGGRVSKQHPRSPSYGDNATREEVRVSQPKVAVVFLETINDDCLPTIVAFADVRIGDVLIYGFEVYRNKEGKLEVYRPRVILDVGLVPKTFNYLDSELEERVEKAILKAYAKDLAQYNA